MRWPDIYDLLTAAGLGMLVCGLSLWSLALALTVGGVVLASLGLAGAWRKGNK